MSKIPAYNINKNIKIENKQKENYITIQITKENFKYLEKCLEDPAFISSISKLIFKENPDHFQIGISVISLT